MITLSQLKERGCLSERYEEIPFRSAVSLSDFCRDLESGQAAVRPVVLDNCQWAATENRMPISRADAVISCDGEKFGRWKKSDNSFTMMALLDSKLHTIKIFKHKKEDTKMGPTTVNVNDKILADLDPILTNGGGETSMDLDQVTKELAEMEQQNGASQNKLSSDLPPSRADFDGTGASEEDGKSEAENAKKLAREKRQRENEEIMEAVIKVSEKNITLNDRNITNNRQYGRALFFITAADDVVKPGIIGNPVLDPNNKKQLIPNAPQEIAKKFAENGEKGIARKYFMQKAGLKFTHSKPGKILGLAVRTPLKSEGSLLDVCNPERRPAETKAAGSADSDASVVRIMSNEAAYAYLAYNYGNVIWEDDTVLGAKASALEVKTNAVNKSDSSDANAQSIGKIQPRLVPKITVRKVEGVRTSVITEGNFFPVNTYETSSVAGIDEETKKLLNNNFAAILKSQYNAKDPSNGGARPVITPELVGDSGLITVVSQDTNTNSYEVTTKYINGDEKITVSRYDDKTDLLDVRLPIRKKEISKSGTCMYKYVKIDMEDAKGSLNNPRYADLVKMTGFTSEEFAAKIRSVVQLGAKSKSHSSRQVGVSSEQYLAFIAKPGNSTVGSSSLGDLQRQILGVDM